VTAPPLRAVTPAVALTLGIVLLACLILLGVSPVVALAAAGVAAAAAACFTRAQR
jgi:hypothetical protein